MTSLGYIVLYVVIGFSIGGIVAGLDAKQKGHYDNTAKLAWTFGLAWPILLPFAIGMLLGWRVGKSQAGDDDPATAAEE